MTRRKHLFRNKAAASNVIYVSGIPLSKDIVDDPADDAPVDIDAPEAFLDAQELFKKYDRDHSGGIDLDEFKLLLRDLQVDIPDGKAIVYFRKCDIAQKGYITFEEFRVALFTFDPSNPSRTGGFQPAKSLTPKDVFTIFDEDDSGELGRDEFERVLKFLKIKMALDKMEAIFSQHENPDTEALNYKAFRTIWLSLLVDVRKELSQRNIPYNTISGCNKLLPKSALVKKLEAILDKEEAQEQYTILEAKWNLEWERIRAERERLAREARRFANYVLSDTLDAAGQVYVFGKGTFNRFDGAPAPRDFVDCPHFKTLLELWTKRLRGTSEVSQVDGGGNSGDAVVKAQEQPKTDVIAAQEMAFQNRLVAINTAWLWGRRIKQVSCGTTVAYALTDSGELFCWGGTQRRWNYLYHQNDETLPLESRPFTARTEQLKLVMPSQVAQDAHDYDQNYARRMFKENAPPQRPELSPDEQYQRLLAVVNYFALGTDTSSFEKLNEMIEFDLNAEKAASAIRLRGLPVSSHGKQAIVDDLGKVFLLEIECMGVPFHERMKRLDTKLLQALHNNNTKLEAEVLKKGATIWKSMRKLLKALDNEEETTWQAQQNKWDAKRDEIRRLRGKQDRMGREGIELQAVNDSQRTISPSGLTTRGPPQKQFHGKHALHDISVGSKHALAIHNSGKLYGWGFGSFGRLGNANHEDMPVPKPLNQLSSMRFHGVACGYSHSLALRSDGQIFVWGSAATGKLGLEPAASPSIRPNTTPIRQRHSKQTEDFSDCFTIMPLPLPLPTKVKKIACGPSHSAAITVNGELFVWGSGDGGRLGLGDGRFMDADNLLKGGLLGVLATPTHVVSLKNHYLVDVSCGVSHTAVLSDIKSDSITTTGGLLFVCGSAHSLGKFCPAFATLPELQGVPIVAVSCGNAHTAAVSVHGELYSWGNNAGGCTGHELGHRFIQSPTKLTCMYQVPQNMARSKQYPVRALQSSINSGYLATFALDGNTDGQFESTCTQTFREICPFWQVDLGVNCRLHMIRIWNRTGDAGQHLFPCHVMISESPFEPEGGKLMLRQCLAHSVHLKFKLEDATNPLVWRLPEDTFGRYIRIQLDSTNILSLAQVEVFGVEEWRFLGPKVSSVACGDDITVVVCRPYPSQSDIDTKYLRALCADIAHRDVLREYHTFGPCEHKFVNLTGVFSRCLLCSAQRKCPICTLFDQLPLDHTLPPDFRTTHSLQQVCDYLLSHRPPRQFKLPASVAIDDEKRLLRLAVDDEAPESEVNKVEALANFALHKAKSQLLPAIQEVHETIRRNSSLERPMTTSILTKARVSWEKYTKKPATPATPVQVQSKPNAS
ncbi:hypothetical protein Ae201684_001209 [Aphanomyces euteiches]|uniref:EF-hand domain-containing protein n=1 Tax=Aphanomyces euteiches TaxID=100861 RepID=A0A6G0XW36_9STRA|nr:hypothetical protein Ae201684_001209 [Aphanomyces euteiches]KAH9154761.1 hypothetical protein AeRB84_003184 [Aphanomyces euteiches]